MSPMTSWSTWSMKVISRHCAACCKACCDGMDWSTHHGTILMTYQVPKRLFPLRPGQHLKGDEPRALSNSIFRWRIHRSRESPFHFDFCFAQSLAEQHNPSQPHTLTHSLLHIAKGPVLTQREQKKTFSTLPGFELRDLSIVRRVMVRSGLRLTDGKLKLSPLFSWFLILEIGLVFFWFDSLSYRPFVEHPHICGATPIVEDNSVSLIYQYWNCLGVGSRKGGQKGQNAGVK